MTEGRANIKVNREAFEHHNARRRDMGLSWEEYIDGQAPDLPTPEIPTADLQSAIKEAVREELPDGMHA